MHRFLSDSWAVLLPRLLNRQEHCCLVDDLASSINGGASDSLWRCEDWRLATGNSQLVASRAVWARVSECGDVHGDDHGDGDLGMARDCLLFQSEGSPEARGPARARDQSPFPPGYQAQASSPGPS